MKNRNKFWIFSLLIMGFVLILTNSCKKDETNTAKYTIGQNFGGGIIFYIDGTKEHGLICASIDQSSEAMWSVIPTVLTNASGTEIGTGQANTTAIVIAQDSNSYNKNCAAEICNDLVLNGFSDWYLPSLKELMLMKTNLKNIGNFNSDYYWSSSEYDLYNAWAQNFAGNDYKYINKPNQYKVRAVRSF